MLKKTIITVLAIITVSSWGYAFYKVFAPKEAPTVNVASVSQFMMLNSEPRMMTMALDDEINSQEIVYYYDDDADSDYVLNQILLQVAYDMDLTNVSELPFTFKVVSSLDYTTSSKRKSEYGFATYPAIVIYETNDDNELYPVSSLEYNIESPFTVNDVEDFLKQTANIEFPNK